MLYCVLQTTGFFFFFLFGWISSPTADKHPGTIRMSLSLSLSLSPTDSELCYSFKASIWKAKLYSTITTLRTIQASTSTSLCRERLLFTGKDLTETISTLSGLSVISIIFSVFYHIYLCKYKSFWRTAVHHHAVSLFRRRLSGKYVLLHKNAFRWLLFSHISHSHLVLDGKRKYVEKVHMKKHVEKENSDVFTVLVSCTISSCFVRKVGLCVSYYLMCFALHCDTVPTCSVNAYSSLNTCCHLVNLALSDSWRWLART